MNSSDNQEIVLRFLQALSQGPIDELDKVFAEDATGFEGNTPIQGLAHAKAYATSFQAAFPDWRFEIDHMVAAGDWVAVTGCSCGTPVQPVYDAAPTGKRIRLQFVGMYRVADGKIQEARVAADSAVIARQLAAE